MPQLVGWTEWLVSDGHLCHESWQSEGMLEINLTLCFVMTE